MIIPTKEEVAILLRLVIGDRLVQVNTIGELLGMKLADSLMPKLKGEPEWGYEGLKKYFVDHNIDFSCTIKEALEKLNTQF